MIKVLIDDPSLQISTARIQLTDPAQIMEPSVVKVVIDEVGNALYFSRAPIPFPRDAYMQFIGSISVYMLIDVIFY